MVLLLAKRIVSDKHERFAKQDYTEKLPIKNEAKNMNDSKA